MLYLIIVGVLMVSQVPYVHLANRAFRGRRSFPYFFSILLLVPVLWLIPHEVIFLGFNGYIIYGLAAWGVKLRRKARVPAAPAVPDRDEEHGQHPGGKTQMV